MQEDGILKAFADCFDNSVSAGALLAKINVSKIEFAQFGYPNILEWWDQVIQDIERKEGAATLTKLLQNAADCFPGNSKFTPYLLEQSKPENRKNKGGNVNIKLPETFSVEDVVRIINLAKAAAMETGADVTINLGQEG